MKQRLLFLVFLLLLLCATSAAADDNSNRVFPGLVSVEPNWALRGQTLGVTITGQDTYFSMGSPTVWFEQGSSTIVPSWINPTSMTSINIYLTIPANAPYGAWDVNVIDPVIGPLILYSGLAVNPDPKIVSMVPDSGARGADLWVAMTGTDTYFGMASTTLVWFHQASQLIDIPATTVNVIDRYHLNARFQIPQDVMTGKVTAWVWTLDYPQAQSISPFKIYEPGALISITPDSAGRSSDLWVTISGTGTHFGQGSATEVYFARASTTLNCDAVNVLSPSQLQAHIAIPSVALMGPWDVHVNDHFDPNLVMPGGFRILAMCGDFDGSANYDLADVVYLIRYIFLYDGPAPLDIRHGDIDCSGDFNIADAVYMVNYIFRDGPAPCEGCQ